jgi:O-antigen ligase
MSIQAIQNPDGSLKILDSISWIFWVLLLITIPITSSPLIARFTSESPVSPLSGLPLLLLTAIWLLPYLLRGGKIPKVAIPLLAFVIVVLVSSFRAHFLEIYPFKGNTVFGRELRSMITLGMGICFFLVTALLPRSESKIKSSLRWLYLGATLLLIWSTIQAVRLPFIDNPPPLELARIHKYISFRDLFRGQVTGMAFEPSWFADQMVVLYIPLWLGSVVKGYSVFNIRWKRLTGELLLLLWGIVVLFFSFSRIGLLAFFLSLGVLLIVGSWNVVNNLAKRKSETSKWSYRQLRGVYFILIVLIFLIGITLTVYLAAQTNERIRDILSIDLGGIFESERLPFFYNLVNNLEYAERLMYWINAFLLFSQFPFLGVGLGNAGFFFADNVPAFGLYLPEVLHILGPHEVAIANPKSLWFRLIGETGFIGFGVFLIFLLILGLGAIKMSKQSGLIAAVGVGAGLGLVALIFEGFSLDTFALPQLWVVLGLLTAVMMQSRRKNTVEA